MMRKLQDQTKYISVIFPTYNGWADTKNCLKSLEQVNYPKKKIEIMVVDNHSSDNTSKLIKQHFPKVIIFEMPANLGYSKAVNVAIRKSKADYILLTNNDVYFDQDYFTEMVALAETDPKIGILGGMVLRSKSKVFSINQNNLAFNGLKINPYIAYRQYDLDNLDQIRECDIVPSGGFFVRASVFKKIGLLDEGFFLYFEDVDFCIRAKKSGFKVMFNPKAISYHGYSKTTYREFSLNDIILQGYKSKWRCIFKHASPIQIITSLILQFSILIVGQNMRSSVKTYKPMFEGVVWNIKNIKCSETMSNVKKNRLLLLILLIGIVLRLISLYSHDIWFDESISYFIASSSLTDVVRASMAADNQPFFYFIILHFFIKIFGDSELVLRLPSLIFGVIAILVNFYFSKKFFNKKVAIYSSAFLSFSPLMIYYSSETRPYSLFMLLTLISSLLFLKLSRNITLKDGFYFMLFLLAAFYTHYYALLLLIPYFYIVLKKTSKRGFFLLLLLIPLAFTLPLLKFYLNLDHPKPSTVSTLLGLPSIFASFILGGTGVVSLRTYFSESVDFTTKILFASSVLISLLVFLRGFTKALIKPEGKSVVFIFTLPIIFISLANLSVPVFSPRSFIFLAPYFFILMALGLENINKRIQNLVFVFICLLFIGIFTITFLNPIFRGPNFKKLASSLDLNKNIYHSSVLTYYPFEYYGKEGKNILVSDNPLNPAIGILQGKKESISGSKEFIFLEIKNGTDDLSLFKVSQDLEKKYNLLNRYDIGDITVKRYTRKKDFK